MPLFHPLWGDPCFDREIVEESKVTKWQLFKARIFGTRFVSIDNGIKITGYRLAGIIYIVSVSST